MEAQPQETVPANPQTGEKKPFTGRGIYENKPGRLIVRNLQYDIKEKHLKQNFSKFGDVIDANVPLNMENNLNKGFGFVEYETREEARKAIESMNAKKYKGRLISVDFALSKKKYNKKIDEIIEKNPIKNKAKLKKQKKDDTMDEDSSDWESGNEEKDTSGEKAKKNGKQNAKQNGKHTENKVETKPEAPKEKKRDAKDKKKFENDVSEGLTLFVRNIDYSTTEAELRDFFEDFGDIYFVKLVKSKDNPDAHKGCAFVKFKEPEPVEKLAKVSDDYWGTDKRDVTKARLTDLEAELEFKGRRLAMFKAESKRDRDNHKKEKEVKVDKRNKDMLKAGLVTTKDFVNKGVSEGDMEIRIRLFKEKQKALKKNPNLFVSKARMCLRHLDKRMTEKDLAIFCKSYVDDWKESLTPEKRREAERHKLAHQFKVLKDAQKTDESGKPKNSGIGFIEVSDPDLALYLVNNMNNFVMNKKTMKGLVVDFALEDHRKLLKRKQKIEKAQKKIKEAKEGTEEDKQKQKKLKQKLKQQEQDKDKLTIDQIDDIAKLRELMKATNSRGKRNRIKRKIQRLNGEEPSEPRNTDHKKDKQDNKEKQPKKDKQSKKEKQAKKEKPEEAKKVKPELEDSDQEDDGGIEVSKATKALLKKQNKTQDELLEDKIKDDIKRNKRKRKNKQKKEEDEVDDVLKSFEERINKRLKLIEEAGDDEQTIKADKEFEEVEIEED